MEEIKNIVYDSDYTNQIKKGGRINYNIKTKDIQSKETGIEKKSNKKTIISEKTKKIDKKNKKKQKSILDKIVDILFPPSKEKFKKEIKDESESTKDLEKISLEDQIKHIINLEDKEYNDKLLTSDLRKIILEMEKDYISSFSDYKTHLSPSYWENKPSYFNISGVFGRTYYANGYPAYVDFLWTRDLLSFYNKWDATWFIYPEDDNKIKAMLKKKATQLKASISEATQKGITLDTELELEYKDVEMIRQKITTREERYYESSFYTTIYNNDIEKLNEESKKFEQKIGGFGIKIKPAIQRMDEGLNATLPIGLDDLGISRSMVTTSLAGSFPFISNDLIEKTGILYGINQHTGSLIIFDRFSGKLPNSNSIVLATSGAGKSFTVKLEILRYLLLGIDIIVIDPENEYRSLVDKVGGTYINVSSSSSQFINPFDLPPKLEDIEYGKGDLLRSQIMSLLGLISVLINGVTPEEEALLDKAIQEVYSLNDITFEDESTDGKEIPIMSDLLNVLEGMNGGENLAIRLSKYVTGTFSKLFNNRTNINLDTGLTVFSIRDLEESLKTPAMFNILNFIWTKVRSKKKKRLLVVDEAWIMMKNKESASFLFGLIKRARKYGLGITTITQDIEDFIKSEYGKPIVSNAAMQLLLKQSTVSIKSLDLLLGLSENEKQKLVSSNIGEGLMFADNQHVAIKILASPYEKDFITTDI